MGRNDNIKKTIAAAIERECKAHQTTYAQMLMGIDTPQKANCLLSIMNGSILTCEQMLIYHSFFKPSQFVGLHSKAKQVQVKRKPTKSVKFDVELYRKYKL